MNIMGKPEHGKKWMPVMYCAYYGILKDIAEEHGYALCVHGSVVRDFDLIAVPFDENPKPHAQLLDAIKKVIGIDKNADPLYDKVGYEPNGRICYTIQCGGGGYFDISFTPSLKDAVEFVKKESLRDAEIKNLFSKMNKPVNEYNKS